MRWVGREILEDFLCCCCVCCCCFCFMFSFFDSYFTEFLAVFNCWEMLWKKVVLKIFKFNNQQLVFWQNLLRNTWRDSFLVRFKLRSGNLTFKLSYLAGGFQRLCLNFKKFFQNSYQQLTPFFFVFWGFFVVFLFLFCFLLKWHVTDIIFRFYFM